jgi:hypothetical protein
MPEGSSACIAEIKAATGERLTDDEIEQVVEAIDRRRQALQAEGRIDNIDQRMAEIAAEEANKARMAALVQKKQTALTILARDRTAAHVRSLRDQGLSPKKAVLAIFEGTVQGVRQARHSIYATKLAFEARYIGDMMAEVLREVPEALKLTRDRPFAADIVREMFELREGGKSGRSGNLDAQKVARIFAKHAEISRVDANRLGANIGRLDDWGGPHAHDAVKLLGVTADDWARSIATRLDLKRTFPDLSPDEVLDVLRASYDTITTGKSAKLTAQRKGQFQGPRNLARSLNKDRVFHFKSADDWLAYQAEFGHGNIWTGMLSHQRRMAAVASQLQMLGPNPEVLMGSLLDQLQAEIRNDKTISQAKKQNLIGSLSIEDGTQIRQAMAEASGFTSAVNPDGITIARLLSGYRATQSMAKLGGAVISSISDVVTQAANMKYQGRSLFASYHDQVVGMIKALSRQTGADEKEIAYLLGEGMDGLLDNIHASAFAEDSLPGAMSSAQNRFFRWSGLTGWTDNIRATGARMMAAHMGKMADRAWSALPEQFRFVLDQHGITEQHWGLIREAAFDGPNGNRYVTPDRIGQLPDERFHSFIGGKPTSGKISRAKMDAELALRRFYSDEINFGVIETDARSRRFTLRGTQAGTAIGEALRLVFQFKGWPIAYSQRVLGRAVFGQRDAASAALHIGHLVAGTMLAGYMAMTAKDYLKGYDRKKFVNPDGSVNLKTLGAAFAQGGGAGIYGDFLFGHVNRFGSGLLESAAGPGIGTAADLLNNAMKARDGDVKAADWLTFALQNTPYANLAYVRPAADYLVLNALRESLSPGFLERQRQSRARDYGQSLLYPQTIGGPQ